MKKIIVNDNACIGCGACISIDPEHFEFNDEGLSYATNNDNLESSDLASAISSCPTSAIHIEENDNCNCEECDCPKGNCDCENCNCHSEEE